MSVALLLCLALFLQSCATVSLAPEGAVLGRSVIAGGIELKADPDTMQHSADARTVVRLREGRVVPLILVIRNVGASKVVEVHSAAIALELTDGRMLRAIDELLEPLPAPSAPAPESQPGAPETSPGPPEMPRAETPKTSLRSGARISQYAAVMLLFWAKLTSPIWRPIVLFALSGDEVGLIVYFGLFAILTSPIWLPIVLIIGHYDKKAEAQRLRNVALERLKDVPLAKGEAAGGLLYFAVVGDLPPTLATATLIVPVRRADTGEEHSMRLPLGKAE